MASRTELIISWTSIRWFALGLVVWGCGSNEPNEPAQIALNTTSLSFTAVGQTQQLSPTVTDQQGNAISGASVTWSTEDPDVATVSSTGLVTAEGSGSTQVTASIGSL